MYVHDSAHPAPEERQQLALGVSPRFPGEMKKQAPEGRQQTTNEFVFKNIFDSKFVVMRRSRKCEWKPAVAAFGAFDRWASSSMGLRPWLRAVATPWLMRMETSCRRLRGFRLIGLYRPWAYAHG